MRRAVLLAAVLLAVAGCGSSGHPAAATTPNTSATTGTSSRQAVFDQYVQENGLTSHGSLPELEAGAQAICKSYAAGRSFVQIIAVLTQNGWSGREAGEMNGASVAAFCPQYASDAGPSL